MDFQKTKRYDMDAAAAELDAINQLSASLVLNVSLEEIIEAALDKTMDIIAPDLVLLYLDENEKLALKGLRSGIPALDMNYYSILEMGNCLCGDAMKSADAQFSLNIADDARCTSPGCESAGIRSFASLPLVIRGESFGILGIGSVTEENFKDRARFLRTMASIVAAAISNSLLHGRLLIHTEELSNTVAQRTGQFNRFFNAVEHSPASIVITDVRGNIEYVNPFFTNLTGYGFDEAKGKNPRILNSGVHDKEFFDHMWRELLAKRTWRGEICNRKKDGTLYWEHASISPLRDDEDRVINYIGVKEDITERRETERLKEDVERIMRHDLKNPLNSIINFPAVLKEEDNINEEQKEMLQIIEDAGLSMLKMINDSLDLFRMEKGRYEYKPEIMDITKTISRLSAELLPIANHYEVGIEVMIDGNPLKEAQPTRIFGEDLLIYSMLSNLLTNAIEASPPGETALLTVNTENKIVFELQNRGAVPEHIIPAFFGKYVTAGKKRGTGLGTYSAKLMAEVMGGSICLATSEEDGTRITVTIPAGVP